MLLRGFADFHVLGVLGRIILLVAEGQATLADGDDVVVGVFFIRTHIQTEQQVVMLRGAVLQEFFAGLDRVDFGQMRLERGGALGVQAGGIHGHVIEVADLLGDAAFFVVPGSDFLDQAGQGLGVLLTEFGEGAPGRILRRLRIEITPVPRGILGEIVTGLDRRVHVVVVDAGDLARLFGAAGGYDKPRCCEQKNHLFHCGI